MVDLYLLHNDRLVTDINEIIYVSSIAEDIPYVEDLEELEMFLDVL